MHVDLVAKDMKHLRLVMERVLVLIDRIQIDLRIWCSGDTRCRLREWLEVQVSMIFNLGI